MRSLIASLLLALAAANHVNGEERSTNHAFNQAFNRLGMGMGRAQDFIFINVSYWEWGELRTSRERREYLRSRLADAAVETKSLGLSHADNVPDVVVDKMVDRRMPPAHRSADLEVTTVGKGGQVAVPTSRVSGLSAVHTPSLRTSRPLHALPLAGRPIPDFLAKGQPGHRTQFSTAQRTRESERQSGWKRADQQARPWLMVNAEGGGAASVAESDPYSINFFVDVSGEEDAYMKRKFRDALKFTEKKIEAVDVRLNMEGNSPKTYRFEVTVKGPKGSTGTSVVSKSKHAHTTFSEAVDDMHDTLKRNLLKDKEKRVSKVRGGESLRDSGMKMNDAAPADDGDEEDYMDSKA